WGTTPAAHYFEYLLEAGRGMPALAGVAHHRLPDHQEGEACLAPTDYYLIKSLLFIHIGIANCGSNSTPTPTPTRTATPIRQLHGHVTWQGSTQPDARQVQTATLTLCAGTLLTYTVTTDASGNFTQTTTLPDGPYNWRIKSFRTLANAGSLTVTGGSAIQDMGTMRAGDADNNNVVNAGDFSILKNAFGSTADRRPDFNNDGVVNAGDFGLLKTNFGAAGAPALTCP